MRNSEAVEPLCACGNLRQKGYNPITGASVYFAMCEECENKARQRQEKAKQRAAFQALLAESNLPPLAREWSIERAAIKARPGFHIARSWRFGREGLYLWGKPGTGKTVTVWGLMLREMEEGRPALFLHVPEFLAELRKTTSQGRDWENRAKTVKILALDDLGAEKPTEWVREVLNTIIESRINHFLPTVITSNFDPAEIYQHLGDETGRIADRIIGISRLVEIKGQSFRIAAGRNRRQN